MNDMDIQDFVTRFAAAWAARDGEAFLALWHPDGVLHSPLYDRPVAGKELGRLTELVREAAPDSVWQLLDWTVRGSVVIVEWQTTGSAGGHASTGAASTSSACATDGSSRSVSTWTRHRSARPAWARRWRQSLRSDLEGGSLKSHEKQIAVNLYRRYRRRDLPAVWALSGQ